MNPACSCLHTIFEQHAAHQPRASALVLGDERLSYGELDRRANRLAHHLRSLGVGPETCVAVRLERSFELVVALLGILKAGGAYLPLDPSIPIPRQRYMLQTASAMAVVTQARMCEREPGIGPLCVLIDQDAPAIAARPSTPLDNVVSPEGLAYVTFTSGSTGQPKGSLIPHRSVPGFVLGASYMRIEADDVFLQHSSLLWDALTLELWTPLLCGASCVLLPELRPHAAEIGEAARRFGVTTLWLGAGLFHVVLDEVPEALTGLRRLLIGGEAPSLPHVRRALEILPNTVLINGYGPSECTVFSTCHPVPRVLRPDARTIPIGRPVGDRKVYLLDANMRRVPIGVPGEIYIGGPAVARGYVGQPDLTARSFVPDPFGDRRGARLYRTGDFARLLSDGTLEFIGRRDDQIKLRGFRVELGEIEAQLKAHPRVHDAACLRRETATDGSGILEDSARIVAYVVPEPEVARANGSDEQVASWERVFDETIYGADAAPVDQRFNTTGWRSSYDDSAIPVEEMRAWADDIIAQVQDWQPRTILEIGCGNGMLLLQLARGCEAYIGTDISRAALDYVAGQIELHAPEYEHVRLLRQPAIDFTGIEPESLDGIILSSVVQYFPNIDYLFEVLDGCFQVLRPGGFIIFADLRSLPLAETFHGSVQLAKAEPSTTVGQLRRRVRQHLVQDTELFIDPALFPALRRRYSSIGDVRVRLQRGRAHNELTRFRYSALLSTQAPPSLPAIEADGEIASAAEIETILRARPEQLLITGLINARLTEDLARQERLARAQAESTIASALASNGPASSEVRRDGIGIDPEDVGCLAAKYGYAVELTWSLDDPGRFDAAFSAPVGAGSPALPPLVSQRERPRPWQTYASRPLQSGGRLRLPAELRHYLSERVPDYMVPSAFVLLDRLPLTRNGKLDRQSLPAPDDDPPDASPAYVAPRSALEQVLTTYYAELLGVERVGIHDNFFDLGGHSLLATRLASRVRKTLKVDLPLRSLFEQPTVAGLACLLAGREATAGQTERIAELILQIAELPPEEIQRMLQERREA